MQENDSIESELLSLRMTEMETREQVLAYLKDIHERKLWKDLGYKSLGDFCAKELGYDSREVRDILKALGLIRTSDQLVSSDPATQGRIDALKIWRRRRSTLAGVSAFRVLTNRTLEKVAHGNPKTLTELGSISGIGPRKLEDFGEELLRLLEHPNTKNQES